MVNKLEADTNIKGVQGRISKLDSQVIQLIDMMDERPTIENIQEQF